MYMYIQWKSGHSAAICIYSVHVCTCSLVNKEDPVYVHSVRADLQCLKSRRLTSKDSFFCPKYFQVRGGLTGEAPLK